MDRLLVIGTGLIGGSFALAMRDAATFSHIEGYDTDPSVARKALQLGLIDAVAGDLTASIAAADAVLIAAPTGAIAPMVRRIAADAGSRSVTVFDAGSVKGSVLDALRRDGEIPARFVPCHPMAGSERQGPDAADANLFRGRRVLVTPLLNTDREAVARVRRWWNAAGADVIETNPHIHDEMVALTSHLPHLIAYTYMAWVGQPHSGAAREFAGPGLADFTRIAAADASMWREIIAENQAAVVAQYDGWIALLTAAGDLLRDGRYDELEQLFARARAAHAKLNQSRD
jgi:prephenate dehydrogenase